MKKFFLTISFMLITVPSVWAFDFLYHSDGPYKGKVIDLETGEPIEGAVVAGVWYLTHRFCDAKEAVTDNNGEFVLPKGSCFSFWPFTEMGRAEVVVFKPGYLAYPPLGTTFEERKARMPGFTGHEFQDRQEYNIIRLGKPRTRREREPTFDHAGSRLVDDEVLRKLPTLLKLIMRKGKTLDIRGK